MAQIPKPEDVTAYLAQHQLESVIEEAVNDAVLKQVKVRAHPWPSLSRQNSQLRRSSLPLTRHRTRSSTLQSCF